MSSASLLHYSAAQMLIMGFDGTEVNNNHQISYAIEDHGLGGVVLFDKNLKHPDQEKNIQSKDQVKKLTDDLRTFASCCRSPLKEPLPLFISVDYEGGRVNRLKPEYQFPETLPPAIFATLSDKSAAIEARRMARTLLSTGFNLNFAPLIDVNVYPDNPIIGKMHRSFSEDPEVVVKYAAIIAKAYHENNVAFCYKHFPGHGSSRGDSHLGIVDISETWGSEELIPYKKLLENPLGGEIIMSAHVINRQLDPSGLPASLSPTMLTNVLRKDLNYQGLIIADDLQMNAITDAFGWEESIVMAINAGNDLLIIGNQCGQIDYSAEEVIDIIVKNVVDKKINRERIDDSFERIQARKMAFDQKN